MYCNACGTEIDDTAAFCSLCGRETRPRAGVQGESRMAGHVRLLGIFWLALSAFRLIPGAILLIVSGAGWTFLPSDVPAFVPVLLAGLGGLLSITAVAGIVAGWGLLSREPWARILALVLGCLGLLDLPFGTAIGVYSLWVLMQPEAEQEFRTARAAGGVSSARNA
jgi:hypothetical protein